MPREGGDTSLARYVIASMHYTVGRSWCHGLKGVEHFDGSQQAWAKYHTRWNSRHQDLTCPP
jgi:hypothetical protein